MIIKARDNKSNVIRLDLEAEVRVIIAAKRRLFVVGPVRPAVASHATGTSGTLSQTD